MNTLRPRKQNDFSQYSCYIILYLFVGKPYYPYTLSFQYFAPTLIILLYIWFLMNPSINFDTDFLSAQ